MSSFDIYGLRVTVPGEESSPSLAHSLFLASARGRRCWTRSPLRTSQVRRLALSPACKPPHDDAQNLLGITDPAQIRLVQHTPGRRSDRSAPVRRTPFPCCP